MLEDLLELFQIDNTDFGVRLKKSKKNGRFYWSVVDGEGEVVVAPPLRGWPTGFAKRAEAIADFRRYVEGMGANFRNFDQIDAVTD